MAYRPCDLGQHRFGGKASTIYFARADGMDTTRFKIRVCTDHAGPILDALDFYDVMAPEAEDRAAVIETVCAFCDQKLDGATHMIFVTAYPAGEERRDFWARVHPECTMWGFVPEGVPS